MCKANTNPANPGQPFQVSKSGTTAKELAVHQAQQLFADPNVGTSERAKAQHAVDLASSTMIVDPSQKMFNGDPSQRMFGTKATKKPF